MYNSGAAARNIVRPSPLPQGSGLLLPEKERPTSARGVALMGLWLLADLIGLERLCLVSVEKLNKSY